MRAAAFMPGGISHQPFVPGAPPGTALSTVQAATLRQLASTNRSLAQNVAESQAALCTILETCHLVPHEINCTVAADLDEILETTEVTEATMCGESRPDAPPAPPTSMRAAIEAAVQAHLPAPPPPPPVPERPAAAAGAGAKPVASNPAQSGMSYKKAVVSS